MKWALITILLLSSVSQAFNRERCGDLFPKNDSYHPPYYSPLYISTMVPSTSSYFTSTGPCSMYGESTVKRAQFLEGNYQTLISDAARGSGEQLSAFAELYGCSERALFGKVLQKNFQVIFTNRNENDALRITEDVDKVIQAEPLLKATCFPATI